MTEPTTPGSIRNPLGRSATGLFASNTFTGHLVRGTVAFALLYIAISQQHQHPWWALLAGGLSLVAMRGCPICWTIGLVETAGQRWRTSLKRRSA